MTTILYVVFQSSLVLQVEIAPTIIIRKNHRFFIKVKFLPMIFLQMIDGLATILNDTFSVKLKNHFMMPLTTARIHIVAI